MKDNNLVNDVFIISSGGIPYFSGCFGGENCVNKPNHLLVSGFLAAVFQFSMQFGQKSICEIIFDDSQMSIDSRKIGKEKILIILFASNKIKMKDLRELVTRTADAFEQNYKSKVLKSGNLIKMNDFKSFSTLLNDLGIIDAEMMGEVPILNSCEFSSNSLLKGHIYCKRQKRDIPYDVELSLLPKDRCPHFSN